MDIDKSTQHSEPDAQYAAKMLCLAQSILMFAPALFLFLIPSAMQEYWLAFSGATSEIIFLKTLFYLPYFTLAVFYLLIYIARRIILKASDAVLRPPFWFYLCHIAGISLFIAFLRFLP